MRLGREWDADKWQAPKIDKKAYLSYRQWTFDDRYPLASKTAAGITGRTMTRNQWRLAYSRERKAEQVRKWPTSRAGKAWFKEQSYCPRCTREVSNTQYFSGKSGSTHLRGECKPAKFFLEKIPVQSWKSELPYPHAPGKGWVETHLSGITVEELCLFWGIDNVGGTIAKKRKTKAAA